MVTADVDIISVRITWDSVSEDLSGKVRVLVRLFSGRNEYEVANFDGETVVEIATQIASWVLELATGA